jgi:DNA-directed RNA polymerase specialized sigma24 family protein
VRCLYEDRQRRPGLTVRHDRVSEQEIEQLWAEHRWGAYDVARRIVGPTEADDVVSEVFLTLLEKRAYLRRHPDVGYLLLATRHTAIRRHLYAWAKRVVAMDPQDLRLAEQAMYQPSQPAMAVPR